MIKNKRKKMTVEEFIQFVEERAINLSQFAKVAGVDDKTVRNVLSLSHTPYPNTMQKIEKAAILHGWKEKE